MCTHMRTRIHVMPRHVVSLPEIRRQRVFQAFSAPGTEQLQKLLSVGPQGHMFSNNCWESIENPKGNNIGRNIGSVFL